MIKTNRLIPTLFFMMIALTPWSLSGQESNPVEIIDMAEHMKTPTARGAGIRRIISETEMIEMDRRILAFAKQAGEKCALALEMAIDRGIKSEGEMFSTLYFPVYPLTSPRTFETFYDDYCDRVITPIEDSYLEKDERIIFVVLVDRNGYLPSHNRRYSHPRTGNGVHRAPKRH